MPPASTDRGEAWDYDPGPPANRRYARLFAETPNYRGMGVALSGREEFRWHFGPIFYRGRLADRAARVLVIGQEGAQDESLAHRAFSGGTGARMQHFLRHLGITRSYLFLNTFVYPIFGQYTGVELLRLAQDPRSPIVAHRHALFNYVAEQQDLRLIVAVGRAAKESLQSWILSRGGTCPSGAQDVSRCTASVIGPRVRTVGVVHPGGVGQGGTTSIAADFKRALRQIEGWGADDPDWLPPDPGGVRQPAEAFLYRSAPIPFRDLPYGVAWRIGRGGTSSNRKDNQRGIQMFSAAGRYAASVAYTSDADGTHEGYAQEPGDLPYEPSKRAFTEFDPGPPDGLARLMMGGEPGLAWPDFNALGVTAHASFGLGPLFRGRATEARILVLADQESHDDLFTFRAMTGDAGQRFQQLLRSMGIVRSYLVLRVLPVDTLDLPASRVRAIVDRPDVQALYRAIVQRVTTDGGTAVALLVGPHARRLGPRVLPASLPVVEMAAWREPGSLANWNGALQTLQSLSYQRDVAPDFSFDGKRGQIPRIDLPFGTLRWQGSSGDRALRGVVSGDQSPDYYKLMMPLWASQLAPAPLTPEERAAVEQLRT